MLQPASVRPPLFLSLEPVLKCPNRRCGLPAYANSDLIALRCDNKRCRAKWWATLLQPGDVRAQIRAAFDGNELFVLLLDQLEAPERIDRPLYWQLWLSGGEYDGFDPRRGGSILARSHELIRRLAGLPDRAA